MNHIDEFFSELYFYELDTREKIFSRLQLNFAIYVSLLTILSYMVRVADYESSYTVLSIFYTSIVSGTILIFVSVYFSFRALTGYEYRTFPKAEKLFNYKKELVIQARKMEEYNELHNQSLAIIDPVEEVQEFSLKILSKCIDHNAKINEYRRLIVKRSIYYMLLAGIPILISSVLFVTFDLDTSSPRKPKLIEDKSLAEEVGKIIIQPKGE